MPYPDNFNGALYGGPSYRASDDAMREAEAEAIAEEARPFTDEIETVADALGAFWDFGLYDMTEDDLEAAREMSAWLHTMPENLRQRVLGYVAADRRKRKPTRAITVLGRQFGGYEP
jgi:hypothetical protein